MLCVLFSTGKVNQNKNGKLKANKINLNAINYLGNNKFLFNLKAMIYSHCAVIQKQISTLRLS